MNEDSDVQDHLLRHCRKALKKGAAENLERLVREHLDPTHDWYSGILEEVADAKNDVDSYIALKEAYWERLGRPLNEASICDIAKRLNSAFRGDEAILWLSKLSDALHSRQRYELQIEAHQLEGDDDKAKTMRWKLFERFLDAEDYRRYLKLSNEKEKARAKKAALEISGISPSIPKALEFLSSIQEFDAIEKLIIDNVNSPQLADNYLAVRRISTDLAKHGKALSATLLRRMLVDRVLAKSNSRYYRYAVSDLKKANEFSSGVSDWRNFANQQQYLESLLENHHLKYAFWHQVAEKELELTGPV